MTADEVIRVLNLRPHPVEGGFFRETYRSAATLPGHRGPRSVSTAIYYLLKPGHVSELHVLPGDEVFHFYLGEPVRMLQLRPDGSGKEVILGSDLAAGQSPQVVVPGGVWQGTHLIGESGFALLGCTVAPGFDFADFELAEGPELAARHPEHAARIARMSRAG